MSFTDQTKILRSENLKIENEINKLKFNLSSFDKTQVEFLKTQNQELIDAIQKAENILSSKIKNVKLPINTKNLQIQINTLKTTIEQCGSN